MSYGKLILAMFVVGLSVTLYQLLNTDTTSAQFERDTGISAAFLRQTNHSLHRIPYAIAHRGSSLFNPENTLMSYTSALNLGADAIHANVRSNHENHLFLFHDSTIDRISNETAGIQFDTLSKEEINDLDAGYNFSVDGRIFPFRGKGLHVPTFFEWLLRFQWQPLLIELEENNESITDLVISQLLKYLDTIENQGRAMPPPIHERILISSKYTAPLQRYRLRTQLRFPSACSETESLYTFFMYKLGNPILNFLRMVGWSDIDILPACQALIVPPAMGNYVHFDDKNFIDFLHSIHMDVIFQVINEEESMKRLYKLGADGLLTDRIDLASKVLVDLGYKSLTELEEQKAKVGFNVLTYEPEQSINTYECATFWCQVLTQPECASVDPLIVVKVVVGISVNVLFILIMLFAIEFLSVITSPCRNRKIIKTSKPSAPRDAAAKDTPGEPKLFRRG